LSKGLQPVQEIIAHALAIEAEEAQKAGALGYMARAMVQATMPHKKTAGSVHERTNGFYTFTMLASPKVGLPYGSVPRMLLAWIATEAVKTKSRDLILGDSMSQFMRQLGMVPTGGRWGTVTRLKDQTRRLFGSTIQCSYTNKAERHEALQNMVIVDLASLWWEPKDPTQKSLFESTVRLSETFYDEIINNPVPVDMRTLLALKKSPLALDIYAWLTYRMSYLKKPTQIPWEALQAQFGSGYPLTAQGKRNFKKHFLGQLKKVQLFYRRAKASDGTNGLLLKPSQTHIRKLDK